ncbi:MAG TPA: hypothetical protein ENK85_12250 [Saprospiraceae bacterium]|nr:hypothetical protein [Saprospiraceae bacterium]
MKKLALIGLLSTLFVTMIFAQGDPKKALKRAKSNLGSYNLDQKKYDKLLEAKKLIDFASKDEEYGKMSKTWNLKGQIYNALTNSVQIQQLTNPSFKDPYPDASLTAYESFKNALKYAQKKYQKSDALKGLTEVISGLSNMGIQAYSAKDFDKASQAFSLGLEIHKLLKDNGKKSPFDDKAQMQNQQYITGLADLSAGKYDEADKLFTSLKEEKYDKPEIYDGLYKVKLAEKDTTSARMILSEGRKLFPENKALMYSEINDYLQSDKDEELVNMLQTAIKGEPENSSLHSTLGNVHDKLSQKLLQAGDQAGYEREFALAKASFEKALELKPDDFYSEYSIGTLYYNKAAALSSKLKELESDMSKAGMAKYDKVNKEMLDLFEMALPYFLKAEKMGQGSKDYNTILAIKEIYARKNNAAKAKEYGDKLKAIIPDKQ